LIAVDMVTREGDHEVEHFFARRLESCKTFLNIVDYDLAKEIVDFQRRVL
jgi:hypothetical protein